MLARLISLAAVAAMAVLPHAAFAQADNYPSRPVKLLIPTPPGGATDNIARPLAELLYKEFGQTFVIESRPGGGSSIALEALVRAPKDGYTLLVAVNAVVSTLPHTRKLPFDVRTDVAPVAMLVETISAVGIRPGLPAKTFKEFLDYCRANPGKVNYGANAVGSTTHIRNEMMNRQGKLGMVHVPYKGDSEIMNDLLAGVVDMAASSSVLPFTRDGKVRLLAFMANKRHPDYPDIPTVREGGLPDFDAPTWYGLFAPAGTPEPVLRKLNAAVNKLLPAPELTDRLLKVGMQVQVEDLDTFRGSVKKDYELYRGIVADLGIKGE
jgi:tripartite-type tricarboxylate transporter receptor subunit TctC